MWEKIFGQVWGNLGKNPSHPQKFVCSCTYASRHIYLGITLFGPRPFTSFMLAIIMTWHASSKFLLKPLSGSLQKCASTVAPHLLRPTLVVSIYQ